MIKRLLIGLTLLSGVARAQFGNEWINYSQQYYKIPILKVGIHHLSYTTLSDAGVPVATIPSADFQIFGREKELHIRVIDGGDGQLDPGDYIEFYAYPNDGWLDSLVYRNPDEIANPAYSLYNDTIFYFLSWDPGPNKRMVEYANTSFGSYSPVPYYMTNSVVSYNNNYYQGQLLLGTSSSYFIAGEGWFFGQKNAYASGSNSRVDSYVPVDHVYTGAGAPNAELYAISTSTNDVDTANTGLPGNHHLDLQYRVGTVFTSLIDTIFTGYKLLRLSASLPSNTLSTNTTLVRHQFVGDLGLAVDYQTVSYVSLTYPHTPNLNNQIYQEFTVLNNTLEDHSYFQFVNFPGSTPHIYVISDSVKHIVPTFSGGTWQALIPNHWAGSNQKVVFSDETQAISVTNISRVTASGYFTDYESLQLDSAYLIITAPNLITSATNYANYRSGLAGGGHNVAVMTVTELCLQYGGGIPKHVLGLKRGIEDLYVNYPTPPKFVFLIGKSIIEATEGSDPGSRKNATHYQNNLVPTFGYPASDNLIVSNFQSDTTFKPYLAIGRLAAHSDAHVDAYYNKMVEYELNQQNPVYTLQDKEWMKRVMHFSGGNTAGEQILFQSHLNSYAYIIEDTLFGGNTSLHAKTTSQPIDLVEFQQIQDQLADGVSLMTFFGHASPTGFDQNIDEPQNWNNQGKYPLLLGNSCHTGNIHSPQSVSTSEEFVLIPNRGTIGFMATSKLGFSGQLNVYSYELYEHISRYNYGGSIGISHTRTVDTILDAFGPGANTTLFELTLTQMTLHGDPALKINSHKNPELVIEDASVFFEPSIIDLSVDSITVKVVLTNIGQATNTPFTVDVVRNYPVTGTDTTYTINVNGLHYKDTLTLKVPLLPSLSIGLNEFEVYVDQPSLVDEVYDEYNNNVVIKSLALNFDGISPIWPYKYGIIPDDSVTLKGSTVNPLASMKNYVFEIDTIDFEGLASPFKRYQIVSSVGGVVEANPSGWLLSSTNAQAQLTLSDSTVYFWRVAQDSSVKLWQESSFQYIPGRYGWGQSHFYQFKKDQFLSVKYNRPNRTFDFLNSIRILDCQVFGNANNTYAYANTYWRLDGNIDDGEYNLCGTTPTIYVAVVDPFQLKAWENNSDGSNPAFDFGDKTGCRPWRTEGYFVFPQNNTGYMEALDSMLNHHIPDGHYVLVYTGRYAHYGWWDTYYPGLYQVFKDFGSLEIDTGKANAPFILFWQQGNPASFQEVYGQSLTDTLQFSDTLEAPNYLGNIYSEIAGPAKSWGSLHWKQHAQEVQFNDSTRIKLHGITLAGAKSILIDTLFTFSDSIINLSGIVDASQYPFVQLQAFLQDSLTFTPAQPEHWQLIYDPVPELAVNPKHGFYFSALNDTVQEGEDVQFAMAIENISPFDMDSLLVNYWMEDNNHNQNFVNHPRQAPLLAGQIVLDTVSFNTAGFSGINSFWIAGNPYVGNTTVQDQTEQYYFNNLGRVTFVASPDVENPLLDVTFDGIHILDGDIVSGRALISISLDDENPYLILDEDTDTSNFSVWLTNPNGVLKRVPFVDGTGHEVMSWTPAGSDNVFKIDYHGNFPIDGTYKLRIQASDLSGNKSGELDYDISFEVINASTITDVLNYPNPFSTRTQFIFTLTGNRVPDNMMIQIMTITGKVVREIHMDELGPVRVGRNRTEFWWDGTDMFGDQLANGVYLYRVFTRLDGSEIDKRETGASQYFKKGFGKMYLMR